jgi:Immunoglobulin I-set domain
MQVKKKPCCEILFSAGVAPKVNEDLQDGKFVSPVTIQLSCRVNLGEPTSEVQWFRENKEIYQTKKYDISQDGDLLTLSISSSEPSDSATYRCQVSNKLGSVKTQCAVEVNSKYRIKNIEFHT